MPFIRVFAVFLMCIALAACGGGEDPDVGTPGPVSPTVQELEFAKTANASATFNPVTSALDIAWTERFPNAVRYEVQRQGSSGAYAVAVSITPTNVVGNALLWRSKPTESGNYRVVAVLPDYRIDLTTKRGTNVIAVQLPQSAPSISVDISNLVYDFTGLASGTVDIALVEIKTAVAVNWYLDSSPFVSSATAPQFAIQMTIGQQTGSRVKAEVEVMNGYFVVLDYPVTIAPTYKKVESYVWVVEGKQQIYAAFSPITRIASAEVLVDGVLLASLANPNACEAKGCYPFIFDVSLAPRGSSTRELQFNVVDQILGTKTVFKQRVDLSALFGS